MDGKIRVLVVGCGTMGSAHARAYHEMAEFDIVGVASRGPESQHRLSQELGGLPECDNFEKALDATRPDAVSINTYAGRVVGAGSSARLWPALIRLSRTGCARRAHLPVSYHPQ
jgi:predicted homoserine dehydrogenase-like protein